MPNFKRSIMVHKITIICNQTPRKLNINFGIQNQVHSKGRIRFNQNILKSLIWHKLQNIPQISAIRISPQQTLAQKPATSCSEEFLKTPPSLIKLALYKTYQHYVLPKPFGGCSKEYKARVRGGSRKPISLKPIFQVGSNNVLRIRRDKILFKNTSSSNAKGAKHKWTGPQATEPNDFAVLEAFSSEHQRCKFKLHM